MILLQEHFQRERDIVETNNQVISQQINNTFVVVFRHLDHLIVSASSGIESLS